MVSFPGRRGSPPTARRSTAVLFGLLVVLSSLSVGVLMLAPDPGASPAVPHLGRASPETGTPSPLAEAARALLPAPTSTPAVPAPSPPLEAWGNVTSLHRDLAPSPRDIAMATYDPADGYALLYGGELLNTYYQQDWWGFSPGTGWSNLTDWSGAYPGARAGAMMTWDPADGYVLEYGGCKGANYETCLIENYVWSYNVAKTGGDGWASLAGASAGNRMFGGMADDPADGAVVVFGGCDAYTDAATSSECSGLAGDTWTYNATTATPWTQLAFGGTTCGGLGQGPCTAGTAPLPRAYLMMTYDPALKEVVLFGGIAENSALTGVHLSDDTWTFNNGVWTNITGTAGAPPERFYGSLAWDPAGNQLLLEGGVGYGASGGYVVLGDTWAFRGGIWTNITAPAGTSAPSPRAGAAFVTFPPPAFPTLFGGIQPYSPYDLNDTWVYGPVLQAHDDTVPTATDAGLPVEFDGWATGGLSPYSYFWSYGDGNVASGAHQNHTYAAPGTYPSMLLATDTYGMSAHRFVNITINPDPSITAAANTTSTTTAVPVQFWGNASGGTGSYSYAWDFGDGSAVSALPDPSHLYLRAGTFLANVTVTDAVGANATASVTITVRLAPLGLTASAAPLLGAAPLPVDFSASASGGLSPISITWHFADGSRASGYGDATHLYNLTGSFNATVWANDSAGHSDRQTFDVVVYAPLSVQLHLSANGTAPGTLVTVTATVAGGWGALAYLWSLNGSAYATGHPNLDFTPLGAGNYTLALNVSDARGDWRVAGTVLAVLPPVAPLTATLSANDTQFPMGGSVLLSVEAAGGSPPYSYAWSLNGTNQSSVSSSPTWTLTLPHAGNYTFRAWVVDANDRQKGSNGVTVEATYLGPSKTSTPPGQSSGSPGGGSSGLFSSLLAGNLWLYLLLLVIIVVVVVAAVLSRRRPKDFAASAPATVASAAAEPAAWAEASHGGTPEEEGSPLEEVPSPGPAMGAAAAPAAPSRVVPSYVSFERPSGTKSLDTEPRASSAPTSDENGPVSVEEEAPSEPSPEAPTEAPAEPVAGAADEASPAETAEPPAEAVEPPAEAPVHTPLEPDHPLAGVAADWAALGASDHHVGSTEGASEPSADRAEPASPAAAPPAEVPLATAPETEGAPPEGSEPETASSSAQEPAPPAPEGEGAPAASAPGKKKMKLKRKASPPSGGDPS